MSQPRSNPEPRIYSQRTQRYSQIIRLLEGRELDPEESLALVEEGLTCIREAEAALNSVDERLEQLFPGAEE